MGNSYEQTLLSRINLKQKKSLTNILYELIKEAIIDGTLPIGHRINEQSLAAALSVSRTPIRKALDMLIEEQLVEHVAQRGVVVKNMNEKTINEVFDIRFQLEELMFKEAMKKITEDQLTEMMAHFHRLKLNEEQLTMNEFIKTTQQFQEAMVEIADTPILETMMAYLSHYSFDLKAYSYQDSRSRQIAIRKRINLVLSLAEKDDEILETALSNYINNAKKEALENYHNQLKLNQEDTKENVQSLQEIFICQQHECPLYSAVNEQLSSAYDKLKETFISEPQIENL